MLRKVFMLPEDLARSLATESKRTGAPEAYIVRDALRIRFGWVGRNEEENPLGPGETIFVEGSGRIVPKPDVQSMHADAPEGPGRKRRGNVTHLTPEAFAALKPSERLRAQREGKV